MLRSFVSAVVCARRYRKNRIPTATRSAKIAVRAALEVERPQDRIEQRRVDRERDDRRAQHEQDDQVQPADRRRPYPRTAITNRPTAARPARILRADIGQPAGACATGRQRSRGGSRPRSRGP